MYPDSIKNLIECFRTLPGIGGKTAERLVFSMIDFDKEKLTDFSNAIICLRDKIKKCSICGNISDTDVCEICNNSSRNNNTLLIVEKSKDIILFELQLSI